jgi:hypothetical protein
MEATQLETESPEIISKSGWGELALHTITLPSGAVVKIRIPDLSLLLASELVPGRLKEIALVSLAEQIRDVRAAVLGEQADPMLRAEQVAELAGLSRWLVTQTVHEPKVSEAEIEAGVMPNEDFIMLTQIASRERFTDARDVWIGVEPKDRWEGWRRHHECVEDCPACAALRKEFSTRG